MNGLAPEAAAVEAARQRLGQDLDRLSVELNGQIGQTMEKTAWKVTGLGLGIVAGVLVRKLLVAAWKSLRHSDPPANPASPATTWTEAIGWTIASGVAVAVARLLASRGAAAGWRKVMGTLPPDMEEVTP